MQNSIVTVENSLTISYIKLGTYHMTQQSHFFYSREMKMYHTPYETLYINVYRNLIHNCLKLQTTQIPISKRMNRPIVEHYSSIKRNKIFENKFFCSHHAVRYYTHRSYLSCNWNFVLFDHLHPLPSLSSNHQAILCF